MTKITIAEQFQDITLLHLFEIAVIDKRTNKRGYIIFDVEVDGNKLKASHEALSQDQQDSDEIAFVSVDIDEDFTLDAHLQDLYSACELAIIDSEWFELAD